MASFYYPLIWTNRTHERCLCLIYNDKRSFEDLSDEDGSVSIHNKNI